MSNLMKSIDDRTQLAGSNRLEILLFSLGKDRNTERDEVFGINVFKVREVMHIPEITHAPDMPDSVEGIVSLRGTMVPVINLQKFCKIDSAAEPGILMITEYNKHVQGFLVESVDTIRRLNWEQVKEPPSMMVNRLGGLVTAVTELENNQLVLIMDVEKVLAETAQFYREDSEIFTGIPKCKSGNNINILFADDSKIARDQVKATLTHMGVNYIACNNGAEAWNKILETADKAEQSGAAASDFISLVITDVEMPEMDGYVLTRKIKEDHRLHNIPVIMHSSLSADANKALGENMGADDYVPKFQPVELASTIVKFLE